jgi:hypothetical protein
MPLAYNERLADSERMASPPEQPPTDVARVPDFISYLPEQVWYLTASGKDMWCRRPYGFFFTSSEAATQFASELGTEFELVPIGVKSKELLSSDGIEGMRRQQVTRIFIDPRKDPVSGDVYGKILRIEPMN